MSWTLTKKKTSNLTPDLYESIYRDIQFWCVNELASSPAVTANGQQANALLNFATFDLHALMTNVGTDHMIGLLTGRGTDQTVMLRLKSLVVDLYLKYGDDVIDELRERVYRTLANLYGITYDIDRAIDINNPLWLHPFIRKMHTELKIP